MMYLTEDERAARIAALCQAHDAPALAALLLDLADRCLTVSGYVGATVGRNNTFPRDHQGHDDPSNWRLAHAGRMHSSAQHLDALEDQARVALGKPPRRRAA